MSGIKLTPAQRQGVDVIEQTFWETGGLPTYEVVAKKTGNSQSTVEKWFKKEDFRRALQIRGVDLEPAKSSEQLTSQQLMAANVMLNAHDKRTEREKLNLLQISSQQWHAWLRQPAFSQYMNRRTEALFGASGYKAFDNIVKNVEEGDLNAAKLMLEVQGKYRNQVDVNVNVQQVVIQLVEIVAKHVREPETLEAIAAELETLQFTEAGQLARVVA